MKKNKIEFSTFPFKGSSNPLKANFQGHASYKKVQVKQAIKQVNITIQGLYSACPFHSTKQFWSILLVLLKITQDLSQTMEIHLLFEERAEATEAKL